MPMLAKVALCVLATLVAAPAIAEDDQPLLSMEEVKRTTSVVRSAAFDPASFFPTSGRALSTVRIEYRGDDYDWPVYAIAVARACVGEAARPCATRPLARMTRAPAVPDSDRLRHRGAALVVALARQGVDTPEEARSALPSQGVEWLEADLDACPSAKAVLNRVGSIRWTARAAVDQALSDDPSFDLVLHADTVRVEFEQFREISVYDGWLKERSPGAWARSLYEALEPCWGPATITPPWERPANEAG